MVVRRERKVLPKLGSGLGLGEVGGKLSGARTGQPAAEIAELNIQKWQSAPAHCIMGSQKNSVPSSRQCPLVAD